MTDITWHDHSVSRQQREKLLGQSGCVVWFTGLSGSGKSTVANAVDHRLYQSKVKTYLLDGDNVRHGLNASPPLLEQYGSEYAERFGLGFAAQDRTENIRRIAAVGQLFVSAGIVTLTAFVSPYRADRDAARKQIVEAGQENDFVEVFVDTPLEVCESRDPKGLYKKARSGEIKNFTGISAPYEAPTNAELTLEGGAKKPEVLADEVVAYLHSIGKIQIEP
jgi:adenylylsulfate kinase